MSNTLRAYTSLSSSSSRTEVSNVLQSIIDASPITFDSASRKELIQNLLNDVKLCSKTNSKGRLVPQDASQALLAVKTLGKHPVGSELLSSPANLSTLLSLAMTFKDDTNASNEALRCVANALLLIEQARSTWTEKEVGGGQATIELLEKATSPERIFLLSRILFLATSSAFASGRYIRLLVESKHIGHAGNVVDIIGAKLDALVAGILSGVNMSREAMTDLLKFTFNLLVHYPKIVDCEPQNNGKGKEVSLKDSTDDTKVMGDYWSPKLDGLLLPLLRTFNSLPPTSPAPITTPLTHAIHTLITIPINNPSLRPIWFGQAHPSTRSNSSSSSRSSPPRSNSSGDSPTKETKEPKAGAIDRALSVLAAGRRSLSRSPSPLPSAAFPYDIVLRAYELLDTALSHYLPGTVDPDDPSVQQTIKAEGDNSLDDLLSPLTVLLTRLCIADESSRTRLREWLVPTDLDRTSPLEARADTLGRCLRLLACVHHPRMKDGVGEMLLAMSDSDASTLASLVGYGNVAGFLFNKGIMNAPPPPTSSNAPSLPAGVNPITGIIEEKTELPEMTEEEKQMEAEKLFVLFDRLERTGAMPASQNPMRKAIAQGMLGP